jgi:hypothetical protein
VSAERSYSLEQRRPASMAAVQHAASAATENFLLDVTAQSDLCERWQRGEVSLEELGPAEVRALQEGGCGDVTMTAAPPVPCTLTEETQPAAAPTPVASAGTSSRRKALKGTTGLKLRRYVRGVVPGGGGGFDPAAMKAMLGEVLDEKGFSEVASSVKTMKVDLKALGTKQTEMAEKLSEHDKDIRVLKEALSGGGGGARGAGSGGSAYADTTAPSATGQGGGGNAVRNFVSVYAFTEFVEDM